MTSQPPLKTNPAPLSAPQLLRFCWRSLTSMRTALLLLMLLAVAAVPGSLFPQVNVDPARVAQYIAVHQGMAPWLQRLQVFHVYSSVWFSAVYLLLFISLIGCVLPRVRVHWAASRSDPPRTPRNLSRLPEHREFLAAGGPHETWVALNAHLRRQRFRVTPGGALTGSSRQPNPVVGGTSEWTLAAERGHHRETGNLVFHLALVGLLLAVAAGSLYSYSGQKLLVEGQSFAGTAPGFDSFTSGAWADIGDVPPFALTLQRMDVAFEAQQPSQMGQPRRFAAEVSLAADAGSSAQERRVEVNRPAQAGGAQISLSGNGYAPVIELRDGSGQLVQDGPVPFLPQTSNYDSTGVIKVPDAVSATGTPEQLGLQGVFLPTATLNASGQPVSGFPDLSNPVLVMSVYTGDLGLDSGVPQSVYELDNTRMRQVNDAQGHPYVLQLRPGETAALPDGLGSVTMTAVKRFASLDVRSTPGQRPALLFALVAAAGLTTSLFVPRRRLWVRITSSSANGEQCRVEVAGLSRGSDGGLASDVDRLCAAVPSLGQLAEPSLLGPARSSQAPR